MALIDSCAAFWTLNDTLVDEVDDEVLIAADAGSHYVAGKIGDAWDFADTYARRLTHDGTFADLGVAGGENTPPITLCFWANKSGSLSRTILAWRNVTGDVNTVRLIQSVSAGKTRLTLMLMLEGTGASAVWTDTVLWSGFHHVAVILQPAANPDFTAIEFVVDGVIVLNTDTEILVGEYTPWLLYPDDLVLMLGSAATASTGFDGVIDAVGLWTRALSLGEIQSLYASGAGIEYPFTSNTVDAGTAEALGSVSAEEEFTEAPVAAQLIVAGGRVNVYGADRVDVFGARLFIR
jgi:hypothetical protein